MKVHEFLEYLEQIRQTLSDEAPEDLDLCFEMVKDGKRAYVFPNVCTLYTEDRMLVLSLEGPVTQIFVKPQSDDRNPEGIFQC